MLTFANYRNILVAIRDANLATPTIRDFLASGPNKDFAILRHDVEWVPEHSLAAAKIEHELGLKATYYFHGPHRKRVFKPKIMHEIAAMGHEIGYHFETLDLCRGDYQAATKLFVSQLREFRAAGLDVRTVCAHGNPRVKKIGYKNNNDIISADFNILRQNDLYGEAYLTMPDINYKYISDVGVRFSNYGSPIDVASLIKSRDATEFYILTHMDYWSPRYPRAFLLDAAAKAIRASNVNRHVASIRRLRTRITKAE